MAKLQLRYLTKHINTANYNPIGEETKLQFSHNGYDWEDVPTENEHIYIKPEFK